MRGKLRQQLKNVKKHRRRKDEDKEELPEIYRMTALKCLLVGDIKKHIELREEEIKRYDQLREVVMKWAVNKRIEKERGDDPMDLDNCNDDEEEEGDEKNNCEEQQ